MAKTLSVALRIAVRMSITALWLGVLIILRARLWLGILRLHGLVLARSLTLPDLMLPWHTGGRCLGLGRWSTARPSRLGKIRAVIAVIFRLI